MSLSHCGDFQTNPGPGHIFPNEASKEIDCQRAIACKLAIFPASDEDTQSLDLIPGCFAQAGLRAIPLEIQLLRWEKQLADFQ